MSPGEVGLGSYKDPRRWKLKKKISKQIETIQCDAVLTVNGYLFVDIIKPGKALEVPSVLVIQWIPMD